MTPGAPRASDTGRAPPTWGAPDCRCRTVPPHTLVTMSDDVNTVEAATSPAVGAARRLKDYWKSGEGAARIRWGTENDLTRCIALVGRAAGVASTTFNVPGFCNNIHKELFGRPNDPND